MIQQKMVTRNRDLIYCMGGVRHRSDPALFKGIQDSPLLQPVRNGDGVQWFSPRAFGVHQCEVVIITAQSENFFHRYDVAISRSNPEQGAAGSRPDVGRQPHFLSVLLFA